MFSEIVLDNQTLYKLDKQSGLEIVPDDRFQNLTETIADRAIGISYQLTLLFPIEDGENIIRVFMLADIGWQLDCDVTSLTRRTSD